MPSTPQYTVVYDQGGNAGLKCPDCNQARWNTTFSPKRWDTGQDCANCQLIKDSTKVQDENQAKEELVVQIMSDFECSREDAIYGLLNGTDALQALLDSRQEEHAEE